MIPRITQLVQCDGHRAEGGSGFALEKAKTFAQFIRHQIAQAHVVGNHHQTDAIECIFWRDSHGHIACDDGNFSFKVDAKGFVTTHHGIARSYEIIAAALVHERIGVKTCRHFRVARGAHQFHMVQKGRAIGPLISPGQWGHALAGVKRKGMARLAAVQSLIQVFQLRGQKIPVV